MEKFFLKKYKIKPSTLQLLKDIYPTVDWNRVNFYEGLPWFTPFIAPYVSAQALPHFYSFGRFNIYLKKFDESRAQCLSDIVHEGLHVVQGMNFWKGYGFGMLRGFTVYYSALFVKYGYRNNSFEVSAYDQEFRFLDFCEKHFQHGIEPPINIIALKNISQDTSLVFRKYKFHYGENYFLLIASFLFCFLLALLKPLLDVLFFLTEKTISIFSRKTKKVGAT
jgi:hypothetical protein